MGYFIQIASCTEPDKLLFGRVELQPKSRVGLGKITDKLRLGKRLGKLRQIFRCVYVCVCVSVRMYSSSFLLCFLSSICVLWELPDSNKD